MVKKISSRYRNMLWTCFSIVVGNAVLAFAIAAFVIPNDIIMGGATGIGILINHFLSTDVALNVLILNIAALVLGYFALGKKFVITTIGSSLLYPVFLGLIQRIPGIDSFTTDGLLSALFAGGLIGISVGMVLRVGASTGGTDVLNLVLHKWLHIPVSVLVYIVDTIILGGQAIFSNPEKILHGIVLLVVETILLNRVMLLGQSQIQIFAISAKYEEIREKILVELQAGATMVMIETGCTEQSQKGVLCVIQPRKLYAAKELIHSIDPDAFITVTQIKKVRSQGFTQERRDHPVKMRQA